MSAISGTNRAPRQTCSQPSVPRYGNGTATVVTGSCGMTGAGAGACSTTGGGAYTGAGGGV